MKLLFGFGRSSHYLVRPTHNAIGLANLLHRANPFRMGLVFGKALKQCRNHTVLVGFVFVLFLGLALEISDLILSYPTNDPQSSSTAPWNAVAARSMCDTFPSAAEVKTWMATATARPLFNPSRSPVLPTAPTLTVPPVLPRLAGIMITPNEKIAIFDGADGIPIVADDGTHLGVFKVLSIAQDGVKVSGPAGSQLLRVDYDGIQPARIVASVGAADVNNSNGTTGPNLWAPQ